MLIRNVSTLLGDNLEFIPRTSVQIRDGRIRRIGPGIRPSGNEDRVDGEGLLMIPGFVNAHTHIGDSIGKDVTMDSSVDKRIHPVFGAKSRILKNTPPENLSDFMRNTCHSMIRKGTTTFVDFREGGLDGVLLLKRMLSDVPIRSIILGRLDFYQDMSQIRRNEPIPAEKARELPEIIRKCDGIGVSGANENSTSVLSHYAGTTKIRAIHSAETKESVSKSKRMTGKSETVRALSLKPHILVHMTHASRSDLHAAAKRVRGIVVCPRANASLAEGIPDIVAMQRAGCTLALGTDNVMINSPDMFREMDYLWKVTMGMHKKRINPREILKMATVNAGKILRKDIGVVQIGKIADCVFLNKHALDMAPMHEPHASIVHRASESAVQAVMIGGNIVHGRI